MRPNAEIVAEMRDTKMRPTPIDGRERMPQLGLQEYWYPALLAKKVGTKHPRELKITGQSLVFFRNAANEVVALARECPHRGAYLSHGVSHFKGTLSCPYHGWTFDGEGNCLAVLGEGPESEIPGSRGSRARNFPTKTLKGVVFVWMGDGKPAPIEEDVPPEFFSGKYVVAAAQQLWNANWRPSIENYSDAHVYFLHRNSIEMLTRSPGQMFAISHFGSDRPPIIRVNDRALIFEPRPGNVANHKSAAEDETNKGDVELEQKPPRPFQDTYPALGGGKWPPTRARLYFSRFCGLFRRLVPSSPPMTEPGTEWGNGLHLPCTVRVDYRHIMFTRFEVPVDEGHTNNFYFLAARRKNLASELFWKAYINLYYRWKMVSNFSRQDGSMAAITDYTTPERLSPSDRFPREWRRFVIECARKPKEQ